MNYLLQACMDISITEAVDTRDTAYPYGCATLSTFWGYFLLHVGGCIGVGYILQVQNKV